MQSVKLPSFLIVTEEERKRKIAKWEELNSYYVENYKALLNSDSQNVGKYVLLYEENGVKKIIIGNAGNEMSTLIGKQKYLQD